MSLPISSAASLDSTTLAASDLLPVLDISASAGNKGSNITATELARAILGFAAMTPIILRVKNVTVLTSGAPADIASISVPAWVTRWALRGTGFGAHSALYAEGGSGNFSAASFTVYDGANGSGNAISGTVAGGATAERMTAVAANTNAPLSTSNTIYIRQTANSANAATASFYLVVFPFL